jgi:hypothetical protein
MGQCKKEIALQPGLPMPGQLCWLPPSLWDASGTRLRHYALFHFNNSYIRTPNTQKWSYTRVDWRLFLFVQVPTYLTAKNIIRRTPTHDVPHRHIRIESLNLYLYVYLYLYLYLNCTSGSQPLNQKPEPTHLNLRTSATLLLMTFGVRFVEGRVLVDSCRACGTPT